MSDSAPSIEVEGYSAADPIEDEAEWRRVVADDVARWWEDRAMHDRDGYLCEVAGSPQCLDWGHTPEADGTWDRDTHPEGWDVPALCPATTYGTACTYCESDDCGWSPFDATALWKSPGVSA